MQPMETFSRESSTTVTRIHGSMPSMLSSLVFPQFLLSPSVALALQTKQVGIIMFFHLYILREYFLTEGDKSSLNDPKKTDAVQEDDEEAEDVEQEDVDNDGDKEEGTEEEDEEEEDEVEDEPPTTRSQTRKRRPRKDN